MSPSQVKKREIIGLVCIVVAAMAAVIGLAGLFVAWEMTFVGITAGVAGFAAGAAYLTSIPNVVRHQDR